MTPQNSPAKTGPDPMYEEEACWQCRGDGWYHGKDCDVCDGTGLLYTENAIKLQGEL